MVDIVLRQGQSVPGGVLTLYKDLGSGQYARMQGVFTIPNDPQDYAYSYFTHVSGPAGTEIQDLNTNSSIGTPSVFEFEIPINRILLCSRFNIVLVDNGITPGNFGGINGGLSNGCLFQIIASDGSTELLDLTGGVPIKTNADFAMLAGIDAPITTLPGADMLPIRYSVFKAGSTMKLTTGQRIRWTNRDDLGGIGGFRIMMQGIYAV